ncbi:MAG: hypothetical protein A3C93_06240 [Candidatus Lloydbacteria bacterium RIFCSPHIGHO2_02_FULL_54_17]|uniref:Uncharacterized protein n=1 Tax=Candidatus Lloydbacteria bacterium RIFCSPHIGHO2_02_FULL_54_17 TaxID=1798664 RepID=A0A1G2DG89_9BACT|nr:MAG: hypothetical protein A3C93_06240 [Candidatus Lloydbacteria bacterium RIFCSPHIGHO2_02_FULL_54_17]OGZ13529.1 MAG: hypothetical protein A2948_04905 [Candidatus Lloydbacteria bacterium RIFCSPLOWO2_01_FULL_54_18]OGZ16200.1 MAG: hypothetical protein A3H76_03740 [Candidatus Lloydbacteria bacterium RIFCSPLOWO2_02_FULL_54_12]
MSEREPSFVMNQSEMERAERHGLSPRELELRELKDDFIHHFAPNAQEAARKRFAGESLSNEDQSLFDRARNKWWFDKYGFPHARVQERVEVLTRKYMVSEDLTRRRDLQRGLFEAVRKKNVARVNELRGLYEKEFPEQMEGVVALLDFPSYLSLQKKVGHFSFNTRTPEGREERKEAIQSLTQYHFLLSHFVEQNSDDKAFLEDFWYTIEQLGVTADNLRQAQITRSGIVSQVAAYKIFKQLGQHPQLSHPREDAFEAIDMWSDADTAIQVKTGKRGSDELIVATDTIAFPGVESKVGDAVTHVNTDLMRDIARFTTKSAAYGEKIGKKIRGYYAVIPKQTFDHVTGEPSEEIVERFRERLGIAQTTHHDGA